MNAYRDSQPARGIPAVHCGEDVKTLVQHNAFEQKPTRLTMINSAYQLVLFVLMALPVGLLQ